MSAAVADKDKGKCHGVPALVPLAYTDRRLLHCCSHGLWTLSLTGACASGEFSRPWLHAVLV